MPSRRAAVAGERAKRVSAAASESCVPARRMAAGKELEKGVLDL